MPSDIITYLIQTIKSKKQQIEEHQRTIDRLESQICSTLHDKNNTSIKSRRTKKCELIYLKGPTET